MIDIRVIGTGNIGRRHIQAIAELKEGITLACFDVYEASLSATKKFIADNKLAFEKVDYYTEKKEILENVTQETIFIVATTAKGRAALLADILSLQPKTVIVEKPVTQTQEEYVATLELSKKHGVPIYCNLSNHTYPGYKEVLQTLQEREHITCTIDFEGSVGFACNGIHYIETVSWLLGMKKYDITDTENIKVFDSKRAGFQDFEGSAAFTVNDKHHCTISIQGTEATNTFQLTTEKEVMTVFEALQKIVIVDKEANVTEKAFPILYTSQITNKVVEDILTGEKPDMPTLEEATPAHQLLFDVMKKHDIQNINIT